MRKEELDTPALIVDLDILKRNITDMADFARAAGVKLRPMTKTHKCPAIAHLQLEAGATGIQVAKLSEGEVMEAAGIKDIFISNQIVGAQKINRLLRLARRAKIRIAVDSAENAREISKFAEAKGMRIDTLLDIDTGIKRTGVLPGKPALELANEVAKLPGLNLIGVYTHEGIVYRAKNKEELHEIATRAAHDMVETAELLRDNGVDIQEVSLGSTPGAKIVAKVKGVTEIRPGAYVFNDTQQYGLGVCTEEDFAATVLTTIISVPADDRAICDAGSKAAGPDSCTFGAFTPPNTPPVEARRKDPTTGLGLVRTLDGEILWDIVFDSKIGEEYGLLRGERCRKLFKVGDKVEIIPIHCCGTVFLYDEIIGIRDNEVEAIWPISARGKVS
jgi:D-serine deaminase-like pyridoxal phosphate-dependent protein